MSIPEKRDEIKETWMEKYGVDNPMISEKLRKDFIISKDVSYIKYIGSNYSLFNCKNNHEFTIHIDNYHNRLRDNLPLCTVCYPIGNNSSIKEIELLKYIKSVYSGEIIGSYRDGLEIDIYLPELKIGFEFNGLFWHSEEWKQKNYHLEKTNYFKDKSIRIIHIWEDDWDYKQEIVKSQIKNWLGLAKTKIYARKCHIRVITDVKCFLNENHIQGYVNSNLKLGLYYQEELVSIMTFDHFEGRKKMLHNEWNLNRFCTKLDHSIVGGASKLLSYFIQNYKPTRIISYADKDWSQGELYKMLGFDILSESNPDYKYIIENKRRNKQNFKKSNLKIGDNISESEFMKKSHIKKIWDCGKIKFEKYI